MVIEGSATIRQLPGVNRFCPSKVMGWDPRISHMEGLVHPISSGATVDGRNPAKQLIW